MTQSDPTRDTSSSVRSPLRDSPLWLALQDVRTYAMIARAYARAAHRDGDTATERDLQLLEQATEILLNAQRILASNDPDAG